MKLFRATQGPDKHKLKDVGILLFYVCCVKPTCLTSCNFSNLSHLFITHSTRLSLFPWSVLCPVIIHFCLCMHVYTLLSGKGGLVQLFIRYSLLKRCHFSTFSSLPEMKFPKCVQIPYFSCKCMQQKLKQQHKESHSCRKYVNPHYRESYLQCLQGLLLGTKGKEKCVVPIWLL